MIGSGDDFQMVLSANRAGVWQYDHASGASTGRSDQPLQRYFRDIEMYRLHIQNQPNLPTARGKVEFGLANGIFD